MRLLDPTTGAIVAVSKAVATELSQTLGLAGRSIRVIYNPVPVDEVVSLSRTPAESAWFQPGEGDFAQAER
jgi:ABC-type cobalamin/Fe3+-siderophores transport system ATPase subunit